MSVLVFDPEPAPTTEGGSEQPSIVLDETQDVLVFDPISSSRVAEGDTATEFVIFDAEQRTTETVVTPADFLLVDAPKDPPRVVLDARPDEDLLVITPGGPPGPTGPQGPQGAPGPQGPAGANPDRYMEAAFASPANQWVITHGFTTYALSVETFDQNGDPMEGLVKFVSPDQVTVDWYYPTAGSARVFE